MLLLKKTTKHLVVAGLITGLWLAQIATVMASSGVTITVKSPNPYTDNQSWFIYEKKPGETIEDVASIKNFGSTPADVKIYAVDATSNTSGSFVLKFTNDAQAGIGAWTEVKTKQLTIQPDERIDVPFTINIPMDATPSQYFGGIVVETGDGLSEEETKNINSTCVKDRTCGANVTVKTRIGSRIYLTIPGNLNEKMNWSGFNYGQTPGGQPYFEFTIENTGNVAHEPKATIEIYDGNGKLFDKFEAPLGECLPGTTIDKQIFWNKKIPIFGNFTAKATVDFYRKFQGSSSLHGMSINESKSIGFLVMPWTFLFITAGILFCWLGLKWYTQRRLIKIRNTWEKYEPTDNEDIISLAEKREIPWELLAKINDLKPPYVVKKGHTVYVPKNKKE